MHRFRSLISVIAPTIRCSAAPAARATSRVSRVRPSLLRMARRASWLPCCTAPMMVSICRVDSWVRRASALTSSATTAKPRPLSPARAASIAAFRASRLVCSAIARITSSTEPISSMRPASDCNACAVHSISPAKASMASTVRITLSCP
ncbi:hypothetical protein D9M71_370760 [compost metagenome]